MCGLVSIMSRIGNLPIEIPTGVTVKNTEGTVVVTGPKGEVNVVLPPEIKFSEEGGKILIARTGMDKPSRALHGLVRAEIANAINGVTKDWSKTLELVGVGFRATMNGDNLVLTIGFSHPVTITPPKGITLAVNDGKIVISGVNRQAVGQIAASIRAVKKPEPYKGKGIKYLGERIRKKAGKAAKAIGAGSAAAGGAK